LPAKGDYVLTPSLRRKLKKPIGVLFPSGALQSDEFLGMVARSPFVVTVGDRVTETLQELGRSPDVFVVDGRERRAPRELPRVAHGSSLKAKNPAGTITRRAASAVRRAFLTKKPVMVVIDGEEDLLTIPAVVYAPLGSVVFYGQPLAGVVAVRVDERAKESARSLMEKMRAAARAGSSA
jgi:GTP-dependent dephospho-CoA kinase